MGKKGQISNFIIIGVILLIFFIFLWSAPRSQLIDEKEQAEDIFDILPIKLFVADCVDLSAKQAVLNTGTAGNYYVVRNISESSLFEFNRVPYFFDEGRNIMPSKNDIEQQISEFVKQEMTSCVDDFEIFEERGFEIEAGDMKVNTVISEKMAHIKVSYPVTVKKENKVTSFEVFSAEVPTRLGMIYDEVKDLEDDQSNYPEFVCISCWTEFGSRNDLNVIMVNLSEDSVLFVVQDNLSKINEIPYEFSFINKYEEMYCSNTPDDWPEERIFEFMRECLIEGIEDIGYTLHLKEIPDMEGGVGEKFYYRANASGTNLTFSDYSYLFDIHEESGIISFTPTIEQVGIHEVSISVEDGIGNEKYGSFKINIKANE